MMKSQAIVLPRIRSNEGCCFFLVGWGVGAGVGAVVTGGSVGAWVGVTVVGGCVGATVVGGGVVGATVVGGRVGGREGAGDTVLFPGDEVGTSEEEELLGVGCGEMVGKGEMVGEGLSVVLSLVR